MQAYIVIAFVNLQNQEGEPIRIYDDESEKFFSEYLSAEAYSQYLNEKGKQTIIAPIQIHATIDIVALKRGDALAKLTETEKQLLNIA